MKHRSYSLYRKKSKQGYVWYVRFWSYGEQKYVLTRSTGVLAVGKKKRYWKADEEARRILSTLHYSPTNKTVVQYLTDFWKSDSAYIKEFAKLKKKPISAAHIKNRQGLINNHIATYPEFKKLPLVELTAGRIKDWMLWLSDRGASNQRIDKALQTIKVALREAVAREELKRDPAKKVKPPMFQYKEKGILRLGEINKLVDTIKDRDSRVSILLGALCGMRLGEVRGLHYEDIIGNQLFIQHNYQDLEGLKSPKCGSQGEVPLPDIIKTEIGKGTGYVFPNRNQKAQGTPRCCGYFRKLFCTALETIGIPLKQQRLRNLSFHSLRHTFITLGRKGGIPNIMIQALARQKYWPTTERYSHPSQIIDMDEAREKLKTAIGY